MPSAGWAADVASIRGGGGESCSAIARGRDSSFHPCVTILEGMNIDFAAVLGRMVEVNASDVHISPGLPPAMRVNGRITPFEDFPKMTPQDTREIVYSILNDSQRKRFENER